MAVTVLGAEDPAMAEKRFFFPRGVNRSSIRALESNLHLVNSNIELVTLCRPLTQSNSLSGK